jgi:cyclophilin family peptidyl-prolyl cis-trans isomerase
MKSSRKNRRVRSAARGVEILENRCLLSATAESQIPTQNLTAGQTGTPITLSTYLDDPQLTGGTVIGMQTPLGTIYLQLTNTQTPNTVANFVQYITDGEYTPTIIQRSVPGFVLQGGGTKPDGSDNEPVSTLTSEAGIPNNKGTIAIALSSAGPDSGTNQWFINLADNPQLNDTSDGGPFTVFGNVIDGGMSIANAIAQLQIIDSSENENWSALPVINYSGSTSPATVPEANLVTDNIVQLSQAQAVPTYTAISANPNLVSASVTNGVLTLTPISSASGSTTVTATITDLGGQTATSTFTVNLTGSVTGTGSFASVTNGTLTVQGTSSADTISVSDSNGVFTAVLNGQSSPTFSGVTGIDVLAGAGNDTVNLAGLPIGATVSGGMGADLITGGAGADSLSGGNGADTIGGGAGPDTIGGGAGNDSLSGGQGKDSISGGAGNNTLVGGKGADTLLGGAGSNSISGSDGSDSIVGGSGGGHLVAGLGSDTITGSIVAGDLPDTITLTAGDSVQASSADSILGANSSDTVVIS